MKRRQTNRRTNRRAMSMALLVSVLLHALVLIFLLPHLLSEPEPLPPAEPKKDFEVSVVSEDDLRKAELPKPKPEPEPPPEKIEEVEPEQPPVPREPPKLEKIDRKVVQQETNEERPDQANYLSNQDNRTSEETRARDTTLEEVVPSKTQRDKQAAKLAKAEVPEPKPRKPPKRRRRDLADPSELVRKPNETVEESEMGMQPRERRRKLFEVTEENYMEAIGHEHDEAAHRAMQDKRLLDGWEEQERIMRGALENFITEVKPGNHTSVNAHGRAWADYLGRIHRKIHARWAAGYLATLDIREPAGSPLNNPNLNTKLEFVIRASDGKIERVNIVRGSGELRFDAEAITIATSVGPHPYVPDELVSPDGNVYVHWNFWRDQRQCGVFGASIFLVEKDGLSGSGRR